MATENHFDFIIVGGGPVGLTLATALVKFMPGVSIAVCDRRSFDVVPDARASAIAAGVKRVFEGIGIWEALNGGASPIARMKITDSGIGDLSRPLFLSFEGDVVPGQPYAHMVPNTKVSRVLLDELSDAVTFFGAVSVEKFESDAQFGYINLADGRRLRAPLVVAADGARSALRAMAGISTIGHVYDQMGIVTTISHELAHEQTAFEHFRPAGPFASLPLPGQRSSLVWTEARKDALQFKDMDPIALATPIEAAMGSNLGCVKVDDRVQAFPLQLQVAREFHAQRLVLIGDAAHVVHPIAGQGLNLGLKDIAVLSEILIDAMRLGRDYGAADVLTEYTQTRRLDIALMSAVTDGLNRLFSNDIAPIRAIRDLGLGVVDRLPRIKSSLIRHAAGVGGDLPKLMRGKRL